MSRSVPAAASPLRPSWLRGLGRFSRGAPTQKTGRNPRTGQPLTYTAYHRVTGAPSCSESKLCGEISADTGLNANAAKRAMDSFKGVLKVALNKGDLLTLPNVARAASRWRG